MSIKISSLKMNNIIEYKRWNGQVQVCIKTDFYWHSGLKSYKKLMLLTFVILTDRLMVLLQTRKFLEFKVRTLYRTGKVQWYLQVFHGNIRTVKSTTLVLQWTDLTILFKGSIGSNKYSSYHLMPTVSLLALSSARLASHVTPMSIL